MKKIVLFLISIVSVIATMAQEQLTARKVFADAPLEMLDMLRPSVRLDMLDYYTQADSIVTVQNALGGKSSIQTMTDDYMKVSVTPTSSLEIKILPFKKDLIAMTLYTVGGDSIAADTQILFFDSSLQPLQTEKFLATPDAESFFSLKNADVSKFELGELLPFQTFTLSAEPDDNTLTMTLTTLQTLPQETRSRLQPILNPSRRAIWTGSRFKFQ